MLCDPDHVGAELDNLIEDSTPAIRRLEGHAGLMHLGEHSIDPESNN
ncbi:MAG: hypothetical protein ABIZ56_11540 [Chthoniobacteraceae bacterium]